MNEDKLNIRILTLEKNKKGFRGFSQTKNASYMLHVLARILSQIIINLFFECSTPMKFHSLFIQNKVFIFKDKAQ